MVNVKLSIRCQIGLEFFEFLKETNRVSITDRIQLRDIYNNEFRMRWVLDHYPNFGSVLYALKVSNKITRRRDTIRFNSKVCTTPLSLSVIPESLTVHVTHFISDKNGISITSERSFENGKLHLRSEITLHVKNTGTETVYFTYYTPLHWLKCLSLVDEQKVTKQNPLTLKPGDSYKIQAVFRFSLVGFYPATLAFEFKPDLQPSSAAFYIVRFIEAECVTSLGLELAPTAPYKPRSIPAWTPEVDCMTVEGVPPEGLALIHLKYVVKLKEYRVPSYIRNLLTSLKYSSFNAKSSFTQLFSILESPLNWENYTERFQVLLYLEELQMEVDIKRYNIPNTDRGHATMTKDKTNKKLLVLEVPGVAENRPSVLRGDKLLVYPVGEPGVKYCGYVHSVHLDSVKLGFSSQLVSRFVEGMKFSVEFTITRLTLRLQHRAAELASSYRLESVLFPAEPNMSFQPKDLPNLRLFDRQLEKNPEQYQAVQHIVAGSSKPAPYLIFGPPGTGKTVTVVEAIKQIEKTQANCYILACTPTNSAADLLCKRILEHVDKRKVYRMYASSWDPKLVPDELMECSNLVGECYIFPAKEELMTYKIMVTTLFTAGRFVSGDIPAEHFTHVFIDEAGHAVETECIIPLAGLLDATAGQVVLAGDPKQLGPILRSPYALKYGMGVSLLERLMNNFSVYQKNADGVFSKRFVTKLLRNYRSHPAILKIPNELFYDGELQACADEYARNFYCNWEELPKKNFPVIFHGVTGIDKREASSPSFFNVAEVEVLMDYVRKLLQAQGKKGVAKIAPRDIGIIAPYRKQVQKIRKALEKIGLEKEFQFMSMENLKVGSVEEFQGQERRVILVSTVRSSPNYTEMDKKFNLGFVKNEKRFNVAVTRAKALLIVVGNPRILETDSTWARFIQYCRDEGGYTGFTRAEEDVDVFARLQALYISIEPTVETAESVIQQQLDPEWRNDM
uniref:RNA helicase n=1 Tax=Astatotilapia calliptera TaxID=8154 RepID=A0AAX7UW94_ASTCA